MPHSICTVSRRAPATRHVPHEERLILQFATMLYFRDNLPDNRGDCDLGCQLVCRL
jgi:hypothetical protein